jgi:predicted ATP-grasp superfamily ATP-dependent carboligase
VDAILTDANVRSSVAGLRGLGRAGLDVAAVAPGWRSAGCWSRYAKVRAIEPDPARDPRGFVMALHRLGVEHGPLPVYTGREESIDLLLDAARTAPGHLTAPFPGGEVLHKLRDKRVMAALACESGVESPKVLWEGSAEELELASLRPPFVLKPANPPERSGQLISARLISSEHALGALLRELPAHEPLLAQESAPGPLISLGLVVSREGQLAARFQHVAYRTWPSEAGSTAYAVSTEPTEDLIRRSVEMLAGAGYWGLAEMEFMSNGDRPLLVDITTRYYGVMPLPLACGVNLPAAWHAVTIGREPPRPTPYPAGVPFRWLEADIIAAGRGNFSLLRSPARRSHVGAMWSSDDPLPGVALAAESLTVRGSRQLSKLIAKASKDHSSGLGGDRTSLRAATADRDATSQPSADDPGSHDCTG